MQRIIESEYFDISVTASPAYNGETRYIVRYGLQCEKRNTLYDALTEFREALAHAMECEGLID